MIVQIKNQREKRLKKSKWKLRKKKVKTREQISTLVWHYHGSELRFLTYISRLKYTPTI